MDIELNYKLIGKRLREIRKKRGYTQEEVSERAGISAQHCSGIECGSAKVSLPALVRLCNALDATPDDVLADSVNRPTHRLSKDVEEVFADASPTEVFLMLSQARSIKEAVRTKGVLSQEEAYMGCK